MPLKWHEAGGGCVMCDEEMPSVWSTKQHMHGGVGGVACLPPSQCKFIQEKQKADALFSGLVQRRSKRGIQRDL